MIRRTNDSRLFGLVLATVLLSIPSADADAQNIGDEVISDDIISSRFINDRMSLVEAIEAAREQGLLLAYSSELVKPWMRVRATPSDSDLLTAMRSVLAEYRLDLQSGPGDQWLIVRSTKAAVAPSATAATATQIEKTAVAEEPSLEEITIVSSSYMLFENATSSSQFLTGDQIRLMPHIADDAYRAFHRLPGVAANDFQAPFNLRGGSVDEVKTVIDGLEIFEPFHMRTLFSPLSIVDPGIIDGAQMLSGGFTTEYGNQMSGVLDISTGRPTGAREHQLGVSFVSAFARSKGSFASGRGTYQFSGRRGYLDLVADTVTDDDEEVSPKYSDIFASTTYSINDSVDIEARILLASDDVEFANPEEGERFGEDSTLNYGWITVDASPNDEIRWTNMVFAGDVDIDASGNLNDIPFPIVTRDFRRKVTISGLKTDLVWQPSDVALWKFGARYRKLSADYDYHLNSVRQTDLINNGVPVVLIRDIVTSRDGDDIGAYAAFRYRQTDNFAWEIGVRWDEQSYVDDGSQTSPRLNAFYQIGERTEIRAGWGYYYQPQGIQELQVPDGVTDYFPAQRAEHRVVGIKHELQSGLHLQLDIYEKLYSDLRPRYENIFDVFEFAPESELDRILVDADSGRSRGIEFTMRNDQANRLAWWVNYTWSEAEDEIDGVSVPRSWDQRHSVTGNLTWQGEHWALSAAARYHSGWPRTPLRAQPILDANGIIIAVDTDLSARNSRFFDDYTRLDLRLSRSVSLQKSALELYLEIFNVLDAENQCCVSGHNVTGGPSLVVTPNFDDFLPFFPSFGFVWTFGPGAERD